MDSTTTEDIDIEDFDENFINDEEEEEEEEALLPPNPYLDYEAFYPPNTNADEYGVSESVSYSAALEAEDVPYVSGFFRLFPPNSVCFRDSDWLRKSITS